MFFSQVSPDAQALFLGLDFFSSATKDVFFKVQGIPFAKSFPVLPFLSLNDSSQLRSTKKTSGDEISQQKHFSFSIFSSFFKRLMLDAARLQGIRFSINSLRRASLFLAEPFSLIRLPLIPPTPQFLSDWKLFEILNFHFWSNVQNRSNSCDGSKWRLGAKLLFFRQIATLSMAWYPAGCSWKFINPGIKTRAMASPLHNRAFWPKQNLGRCLRGALSPSAGGIIMKSQWNCYEIAQEFQFDGF